MNGADLAAVSTAGSAQYFSRDFEAATGSVEAARILYWEKLQAWKVALAGSIAFQTYHGPFSLGANANDGRRRLSFSSWLRGAPPLRSPRSR